MDWFQYQFVGMHLLGWMFWVMLIIPFFWLARLATPVRRKTVRLYRENSSGIRQRRYAASEITTEEYEQRKTRIERDPGVPLDQDGSA